MSDTIYILRKRQEAVSAWHTSMLDIELFKIASRHWGGPPGKRVMAYLRLGTGEDLLVDVDAA